MISNSSPAVRALSCEEVNAGLEDKKDHIFKRNSNN